MQAPPLSLINLTLIPPNAISAAVVGNFSGTRQQEICIVRGAERLELVKLDTSTAKLVTVLTSHVFGVIRCIQPFRLTGSTKDFLIVGSDSGRIVVLEYDPDSNAWKKLHQETYGKSGSRRIVPGQHLAVDPKGRSVMIAAMEKAKLVYILNRDAAANLTISSPLEAHKASAIINCVVGLDVGFDNPIFAALEVDFADSDQDYTGEAYKNIEKMLTYYELDLGLNHVVRRWSEATDKRANLLIPVPGGQSVTDKHDGPSGVIVCTEDHIIWKHQGHKEHRVPIPKRQHPLLDPNRKVIITSYAMHKMKGDFFFLMQTEDGDIFKVTFDRDEDEVLALKIKYFDTVPTAISLCILKSGYLFIPAEFGNHHLYQFESLGEDGDETSSTDYPDFGMSAEPLEPVYFRPHNLQNLALVDILESLGPIVDSKVSSVSATETPQIFTACGRGARSSLRTLKYGLQVQEIAQQELQFRPNGVWSTKAKTTDQYDSYVVLSAPNATLTFAVGESIETVEGTGIRPDVRTIGIQLLDDDTLVQIHPRGLELIHSDGRKTPTPLKKGATAIACTANARQIVVALSTGELAYYLLQEGQLTEYSEHKDMGVGITSVSIAELPEGRLITPFLAVGCEDSTVRILSLDFENCMETLSIQALTASPSSICMAEILDASVDKVHPTLFVNIGLQTGVLLRTVLDATNGTLTDTRTRFLGSKAVNLRRFSVQGVPSMFAMSSRSWLHYPLQGMLQFAPLLYDTLNYAAGFSAELCPDGVIGIADNTLRIFTLPRLDNKIQQEASPLSYTPRRIVTHPHNKFFYILETDHRAMSAGVQQARLKEYQQAGIEVDQEVLELPSDSFGHIRTGPGKWASAIRIVDPNLPSETMTLSLLELEDNEAAFCAAVVSFASQNNATYLMVGTAKDLTLMPRKCKQAYIVAYRFVDGGRRLEFENRTEVDDVPTAIAAYQGRLLAGMGNALRIYEMGKKRLLRKCENKQFTSTISTIQVQATRILVGDMQESIHYAVYKPAENRLLIFADDPQPRWITAQCIVDYDTVCGGDKFGNIFVNRLPAGVGDIVDDDPTGQGILHEKAQFSGAPHKTEMLAHYNVGDIVTSIQKVSLVAGGRETLLYTGFSGMVGMLVPMSTREDIDFYQTLEMHMRQENISLIGRDHLAYRGYYTPQKSVVDGDLCEAFAMLPATKQATIAEELGRTVSEVLKKLETVRTSSAF